MTISEIKATSSYRDTKKGDRNTHSDPKYKKNYQFSKQMLLVNGFLLEFLVIFNVFSILSLYRNKQKKNQPNRKKNLLPSLLLHP
jgi:hypothetical protein